tara:strand:+ start:5082 stop:10211 length:5130 start_codon:yes stop_codon:yes gene_type:complete
MSTFTPKRSSTSAAHRSGARFKKSLSYEEDGLGSFVKDGAISSYFPDIFDGQFTFFPKMEVTREEIPSNLDEGTVPIGTTPASVNYLLQFPTVSPPQFGSADLESIDLHLHVDKLNYQSKTSLPDIEIYKFKKDLPQVGTFGNIRLQNGSDILPERIVCGSANMGSETTLSENFSGGTAAAASSIDIPSLYSGGADAEPTYYMLIEDAWKLDEYVRDNATQVVSGGSNADDLEEYDDRYGVTWQGYGRVVRLIPTTRWDGFQHGDYRVVPSKGQKLRRVDPSYDLREFNRKAATDNDAIDEFHYNAIRVKGEVVSLESSEEGVYTARSLKKAVITTDNTFFDRVQYNNFEYGDTVDPQTGEKVLTSISIPHFSTEGGGGQRLRLLNTILKSDNTGTYNWGDNIGLDDFAGYSSIMLMKRIPKPLKLAKKQEQSSNSGGQQDGTDMNQMRVRIKFCIQHMTKSHNAGDCTERVTDLEKGDNILRSMVVMFATRPPYEGGETLGFYLNKLNTGAEASSYSSYPGASWDHDGANPTHITGLSTGHGIPTGVAIRCASASGIPDGATVASTHTNHIVLDQDTTASATNVQIIATRHADFNNTNILGASERGDGTFGKGSWYINQDNYNEITRYNLDGAGAEKINNYNGIAIMNHTHKTGSGITMAEEQSNSDNQHGRFRMFMTGDDNSRRNYWDGAYEFDSDHQDLGVTDFAPTILKGTNVSQENHQRVGSTFTGNAFYNGPWSHNYVNLTDSSTSRGIVQGSYYYLDAYMNVDSGHITWVVSDMDNIVIASRKQAHSGGELTGITTDGNDVYGFPSYLTIWVNNVRVGKPGRGTDRGELVGQKKGFFSEYQDSTVDILIDSIEVKGFEANISNASVTPTNLNPGRIKVSGNFKEPIVDLDSLAVGETIPEIMSSGKRLTTPSYISWGTHTDVWTNKTNYIYMGDFRCTSPSGINPLDSTKRMNIDSTSAGGRNSDVRFFTFIDNSASTLGFDAVDFGKARVNYGPNLNDHIDVGVGQDASVALKNMYTDSFTKKGFFSIKNPTFSADGRNDTDVDGVFVKRENPMFSTKILSFDAEAGTIEVANPSVIAGFEDDEYIIYRAGYSWDADDASSYYRTGLKLKTSLSSKIELIAPSGTQAPKYSSTTDKLLLHDSVLHELYISPWKYWLVAEVYNRDETNDNVLPDFSYGHSVMLDDSITPSTMAENLGFTFNETRYSDTTVVSNKWKHLNAGNQGSLIEKKMDYGYGNYNDDEDVAPDSESGLGYIQKQVPLEGENIFDLGGLVDRERSRLTLPEENITLFIKSSDEAAGGSSLISTKHIDTLRTPKLTYIYKDTLPNITSFSVQPYEEDPFYPELTWETDDEDLWYGFIIKDNENIPHQYHKAWHVPLNEKPTGDSSSGMDFYEHGLESYAYNHYYWESSPGRPKTHVKGAWANNNSDNLTTSIEGLAGNCLQFNGERADDKQRKLTIVPSNLDAQITNEMSLTVHFTVDNLATIDEQTGDKAYLIYMYTSSSHMVSMWVDKDGRVNATLATDDQSTTITLKSKFSIPVGNNIPTCAILTADTSLLTGNVKLFINGILEDQTGKKTTDGSSKNWKTDQNIEGRVTYAHIGFEPASPSNNNKDANGKNFFNGKIEEIVVHKMAIYPVDPKEGKAIIHKPMEEFTEAEIAAGRTNNYRLFIKDYHNIRGTTTEEVSSTSQMGVKKSGLGLKTDA